MTSSLEAMVETLRVNQLAKGNEGIDADSRLVFDPQLITGLRNQHPLGHCDLQPSGNLNDQNYRCAFP
jgi:hypothetical protein